MIQVGKFGPWIVGAILALLIAAVAVQGYVLYQMQLNQGLLAVRSERTEPSVSPGQRTGANPSVQTPTQPDRDDWFADPFPGPLGDPFAEMERIREQMMRLFDESFRRFGSSPFGARDRLAPRLFSPSADIEDRGDKYIVRIDLPGVDKSEISVNLNGQTLSVSGQTAEVKDERDPSGRIIRQERRTGRFQRVLVLPGPVQGDNMEAKYVDGVLTIVVPKATRGDEPRRVTVL
ncbi:MAG: Hsp20/alpha crystallin family protein [Kiritimatiellae bacterium]|nr:Hsp20/alpha crystallin family protein [Kiritimatiellia bacterium]MDW8459238.1 Hsp20/alpha crystallin family protein [Verrucomicrobiota bacterium]